MIIADKRKVGNVILMLSYGLLVTIYLGWGFFFVWLASFLAAGCNQMDLHEPTRALASLDEYEHLRRILRLCIVHFFRRLLRLQSKVPPELYHRMLRVAGTEPQDDYEENLEIISDSGIVCVIGMLLSSCSHHAIDTT